MIRADDHLQVSGLSLAESGTPVTANVVESSNCALSITQYDYGFVTKFQRDEIARLLDLRGIAGEEPIRRKYSFQFGLKNIRGGIEFSRQGKAPPTFIESGLKPVHVNEPINRSDSEL